MAKTEPTTNFDDAAEPNPSIKVPPLWGSARLAYTICAFFAMVVHLCLRNTINFVILCMVKHEQTNNSSEQSLIDDNNTCGPTDSGDGTSMQRSGNLLWTRSQEFALLGSFYYGYLVTLPIAGRLADKFGGKLFFVHSLTVQSVIFMLIPFFAQRSYLGAVIICLLQGLVAGCGNPALYQLFCTWAHPNERTAFISFAYGGYSVGAILVFPISSFFCKLDWELAFYAVGSVSLVFGVCCHWLIYSNLEDHPRLSKDEYEYLKVNCVKKSTTGVPWKSILTSVPVYAFILTHIFHNYGIIVFTLLIPRFFKEAMCLPLNIVGLISAAPFLGAFVSKTVTITICSIIEKRPNLNLTIYRRIVYVICSCVTIIFNLGIILSTCQQRFIVILFIVCIGITTDLAFSGVYWPSLLYVAPAYAGLISGIANCLATVSGFLAPLGISTIVRHGTKDEWNLVMASLMTSYFLGAIVFGLFGSSKLAKWGQVANGEETTNTAEETTKV